MKTKKIIVYFCLICLLNLQPLITYADVADAVPSQNTKNSKTYVGKATGTAVCAASIAFVFAAPLVCLVSFIIGETYDSKHSAH